MRSRKTCRAVLTTMLAAACTATAETPACFSSDNQCLATETFGSIDLKLKGNVPLFSFERPAIGTLAAQTWQLDTSSGNFLFRNTTGGKVPFSVDRLAPSNALVVQSGGRVAINTTHNQDIALWVRTVPTGAPLTLESGTRQWTFFVNQTLSDGLLSFRPGVSVNVPDVFVLSPSGDLALQGTMTATAFVQTSDRASKTGFADVDPERMLAQVVALPLSEWRFKGQADTHVGPMAQDFHASFGYGPDDKHVAPADLASVALAAIQGLDRRLAEREAEIRELRERLDSLERR